MKRTDVLVVGAGPSGTALARYAALRGRSVILLGEAVAGARVGESLPGAARTLLQALGLSEVLQGSWALPNHGNASAWGQPQLRGVDFVRDPFGSGWHLDRRVFDQRLFRMACEAGVCWLPGRVGRVRRVTQGWQVEQPCGAVIAAEWVVDATGRGAAVARQLGGRRKRGAPLVAVHAWADCPGGEPRTLLEAAQYGWWYTAPLPGGRRVVSLQLLPAAAKRLLNTPGLWRQWLHATVHVSAACPPGVTWTELKACDARDGYLQQVAGPGWLAVGDAALTFDPLSSQGLLNGLYGALQGAKLVCGDGGEIEDYKSQVHDVRRVYEGRLRCVYATEQRWAAAPFWRSRQACP